jgi:S-adenosylmethionine hydrolase
MQIVTLTSDMGHKDHYTAVLKSYLLKNAAQIQIIDISHEVSPFNISQAAFLLKSCIDEFPYESIHIIAVQAEPKIDINYPSENDEWPVVMRYKNQFFVAIDNGVLSLLIGNDEPQSIHRMTEVMATGNSMRFPAKNILCKIATQMLNGEALDDLGEVHEKIKKAINLSPATEQFLIRGSVMHIDIYGNLITNITEDLFKKVGKGEPFTIFFRKKEYHIDKIHGSYGEVPAGERVAIFNSSSLLEIAINKGVHGNGGGANSLFGMKLKDIVRIEFTPQGSRENLNDLF